MKFLVTGAAGFIGFHVSERLLQAGHQVVGIDNLNDYYDVNLKQARLICLRPTISLSISWIWRIAKGWPRCLLLRNLTA